jgi:hypothetical protein
MISKEITLKLFKALPYPLVAVSAMASDAWRIFQHRAEAAPYSSLKIVAYL